MRQVAIWKRDRASQAALRKALPYRLVKVVCAVVGGRGAAGRGAPLCRSEQHCAMAKSDCAICEGFAIHREGFVVLTEFFRTSLLTGSFSRFSIGSIVVVDATRTAKLLPSCYHEAIVFARAWTESHGCFDGLQARIAPVRDSRPVHSRRAEKPGMQPTGTESAPQPVPFGPGG